MEINTEKIFIVEDEPSLQYFYKKILELNGFKVAGIAENGDEGINMFKSFSNKPKVILMDHRMPVKTGIEAAIEILQIDKRVKIIFLSADVSIKEEAYSIGAFSFREKPFTINDLIYEINKALECYNAPCRINSSKE